MRTIAVLALGMLGLIASVEAAERPNILWISAEDISPDLGCYGDPYAITPHLDQFAAEGVRYTRCFAHAGVCAPARSGLITGMYPPSIGTHHMRCKGVPPVAARCFPEYLQEAGYYCTNNSKTDYQFEPPVTAWNESSGKADWHGRAPGQPFFCVINYTTTHESQIRDPSPQTRKLVAALPPELRHDTAKAVIPPYYPDTPKVRLDHANYADNLTALDRQVADVLKKLDDEGLAEDTIVWFWGDHGRGLPRCKRWLYDSGTHVPLLVRVPKKWREWAAPGNPDALKPGSVNEELVAFVDFAPTVLSLAGVPLPAQFQGFAFLGPSKAQTPREYIYGHRDRMDEAYDLIRMVRDSRFQYFRNFMPDVSYGQDIAYMNQMPTMQEMRRLHAAGELGAGPSQYFRPTKPVEELFDTEADPYELHNLAGDPKYAEVLERMRAECQRWMAEIGDVGLIPEAIFDDLKRPGDKYIQTPAPAIEVGELVNGKLLLTSTTTIPGGSLAYAVLPADAGASVKPHWQLLTAPSIPAKAGDQILVKACRLGFEDSPVVRWTCGEAPTQVAVVNKEIPPHWREQLAASDILDRLQRVKSYDGRKGQDAVNAYASLLSDDFPAVRYWALRGGLGALENPHDWEHRVRELRTSDSNPLVQILAAQTLATWGEQGEVRFLADLMLKHPQGSVQLAAAIALRDLGELARPVLADLQAAQKGGEYVGRIAQHAISRLRDASR